MPGSASRAPPASTPIWTNRSFASSRTCSRSARSSPIRASGSPIACSKRRWRSADVERLEQLIDRLESELPPLRRFILAGGSPAGAALHVARTVCRRAERRMVSLAPMPDAVLIKYVNRLSDLLFVLARVVNHRAGRARDRVVSEMFTPASTARLTASKTARASSCDTRSRIAPHSTSTVPVTVSMATSQRSRAIPSGRSSKAASGLPASVGRRRRRHGRDRRAVDQHADRGDQVLVDRPVAVIEALRVLAEQHQFLGGGQLGDDRAAQRPLRIVRAPPPPAVILQRRREAGRDEEQGKRENSRDEITH